MSSILVFCEHTNGAPRRATLESLGAAHATGRPVVAVVTGPGAADVAPALGAAGASKVHVLASDGHPSPGGLGQDLARLVRDEGAQALIAGASTLAKDVLARAAMRLDGSPLTECMEFRAGDAGFEVVRPWLAGKCLATVAPTSDVCIATLRPNAFAAVETSGSPEIVQGTATDDGKTKVVGIEAKAAGKLDVKEAPIVVTGGRGLKEPENFKLIEELAAAFNGKAAVGASRAVVDAGWRPHVEQVGQTGKTVSPQLYFAIGISGAIQHLAGMRTSKVIVAINKDADAPIFKVADYGIVGDLFEVLPALTEAIKTATSRT